DRLSGLAPLAHKGCGAGLVLAHHARIADHVGGEDRGELAGGRHLLTPAGRWSRLVIAATRPKVGHHLIGGAYCRPPLFHKAFRPRRILIGELMPTLRSKISP